MSGFRYRKGTKRNAIEMLAREGKSKRETFDALRPLVNSQTKPMVFSANVGGSRVPKPMHEQHDELRHEIGRVYKVLRLATDSAFESEEIPQEETPETEEEEIPSLDGCDNCGKHTELFYDDASGLSLCDDCLTAEEEEIEIVEEETPEKPVSAAKKRMRDEFALFIRRVREIRAFCEERAKQSASLDNISMRPEQASGLIARGIPALALLNAMTMHWSAESRRDAGIADFDFIKLSQEIMRERGITEIRRADGTKESPHEMFGYVLVLAEARQPIYLVGPAGTGKSHIAKQLADFFELPYSETPMNQGATRGDLLGRHTIAGFISSAFLPIYSGGGVFNFEEIDASDPSMLIVLNNALAQDALYNSADGESYTRSPNFIAISTANTFGIGANREYTARERLDAATIDRWRMGRVFIPFDERLSTIIAEKAFASALSELE